MKYLSLFSGIGGFELGIGHEHECVGYSEVDKYAIETYQSHFRQPRTKEEIENDLDVVKTIVSENNYDIMEVCYVNNAKRETSFIKTINQPVKTALENINSNGVRKILSKAGLRGENIMLCEDSECSICMGEDVSVVENLKKCSLPLNIKIEMDMLNENNMELAICINTPLKNIDQTDTKSCATTVITLKEDTIYAHIKKTKPHHNFGDITKINADELPDFDLLVGGFPCQAFSIAGKRKGFEDTRGTLFFEIARILRAKQPRLFLLENVKGLLSHDNGNTFRTIISTLDELGYDLQWQVLNSKNHGVPQNRERVFIIGHLRGTRRPDVFPIEYNYGIQQPTITERVYYLQGDSASYARELVLGMAQQQGQEISREQMQELFKRTKQSLATGESTEVAEERETIQSQPERDIQEVSSIGAFLGSENDTGGVLGVVSVPTENLLLLWSAAGDATDDTRQIQQQDISVDSGQSGLIETLRTYEHSPLLFAVQPYQGRLFYSVGDGANWTKLYSIKMEELCSPKNTLSSVLEEHPDPKYFLSQEVVKKILATSGKMLHTQ